MAFAQAHKSYYDKEYSFKTIVLRLWDIAKTEKRRLLLILLLIQEVGKKLQLEDCFQAR